MMDKLHKIVLAAAALVCCAVIAAVFVTRPKADVVTGTFTPDWEADAVSGIPDDSGSIQFYSSLSIPVTSGECTAALTAAPKLNGSDLDVYFTASSENTVWLRLAVFDEAGEVIGKSGLLKNGEYVKSVKLNGAVEAGQQLKAKILTYSKETYYSEGSADLTLMIG